MDALREIEQNPTIVNRPAPGIREHDIGEVHERAIRLLLRAMDHSVGAWQEPWPALELDTLKAAQSASWMCKLWDWPVSETLTGVADRDMSRIGDLIEAMSQTELDSAVPPHPLSLGSALKAGPARNIIKNY